VSGRGPRERRRMYVALERPGALGLVDNTGVHVVYRDIRLRPHRGNQKQGE